MTTHQTRHLQALAAADQVAAVLRDRHLLEARFERRVSRAAVTALSVAAVAGFYAVTAANGLAPAAPWAALG